jgi:DNA polymerase II
VYWLATDKGPVRIEIQNEESVFFVAESELEKAKAILGNHLRWRNAEVKLLCFHSDESAVACYFKDQRDLGFARALLLQNDLPVFEGDVRPTDRYLMERFVRGTVEVEGVAEAMSGYVGFVNPRMQAADCALDLSVVSLDIETSVTANTVISIAVTGMGIDKVFMVGAETPTELGYLEYVPDEKTLLREFLTWFAELDPDVVIGWAIVGFDLKFLQDRCDAHRLDFRLGRAQTKVSWRSIETGTQRLFAIVPGRVVLDGIEMLRTATYRFESFSLENVSRELLGRGKLVHDVDARAFEIEEMHRNDPDALARYNLEDCALVMDIFDKTDLIDFAVQRSCLTGLEMDRQGGSVAAFDFLYLPKLHREGYIAPVVDPDSIVNSPGGYVLDSDPGIYSDVVVFDFKSLYPSIIRTFHVDPLAMIAPGDERIPGFLEASFSKSRHILPQIIEELWQARDRAKSQQDSAGSQAIKIIMNSFYGVLGTAGCRFFDARLASSITRRGHEILQTTRDLIEEKGYPVIYGDTDSVFVLMESEAGHVDKAAEQLAEYLTDWWRQNLASRFEIPSFLELEYETHFVRFFMPTVRGSEKGSKKRYAGMIDNDGGEGRLIFKGLESVRSDWTPLAREFQQELYRRVFVEEPTEDYIRGMVKAVLDGSVDSKLVLRRRLRRKLSDYTKNVPPHVRAARLADEERARKGLNPLYENGGWIEYLMTVNGPEPLAYASSPLDYDFYIDRQLAPIADAVLSFDQTSLAVLTDKQMGLF